MTRIKISAAIIAVLTAFSIFSGIMIDKCCRELISQSQQTAELLSSGDDKAVKEAAGELRDKWERFRRKAAIMIRSDTLTEIDRLCVRIAAAAESPGDELFPELSELCRLLELLRKSECPVI